MALAIDMLSMNSNEIDALIEKELLENPCLTENSGVQKDSSFDIALHQNAPVIDFRHYLMDQVNLSSFNIIEKSIALELIYNLDDDGILADAQELFLAIAHETGVYPEWIESVRLRLMNLDPPGCAAISINEALRHQASTLSSAQVLLPVLNKIGANPAYKISPQELKKIYGQYNPRLGRLLNPRPAQAFQTLENIVGDPDLLVVKNPQDFVVLLLKKSSDKFFIDHSFSIKNFSEDKDIKMFKASYHRAHFLIKSLRYREKNLLKVASAIVEHQRGWFFEKSPITPLSLNDIAQATNLHESTVSRLVKNKMLASESGVHELKFFFSQRATNKGEQSSMSVKDLIKALINREDKANPLSDQRLCEELKTQNIMVARRTIAKYREALGILPALERRVFSASLHLKAG